MGDAVNVAARMEQTAEPGTVQITEDTYRLVADLFEVEPLGGVELKGKRRPVESYRVLGRLDAPWTVRATRRLDAPLVGRAREMACHPAALESTREGRGRVLLLMRRPRPRQEPADRGGQRDLVGAGARRRSPLGLLAVRPVRHDAAVRAIPAADPGARGQSGRRDAAETVRTKIAAMMRAIALQGWEAQERTGRAGAPRRGTAGRAAPRGRGVPTSRRPSSSSARPSRRAGGD